MDNLSKYLEDISFIRWVFEPTGELDHKWQQFKAGHPEELRNIQTARKVLMQFRTVSKSLPEEEKILLFSRVLKQIEANQKFRRSRTILLGVLKYAAVALIFFSIGALLFYRPVKDDLAFQTFDSKEYIPSNKAYLIRSNGENVILGDQRSVIAYQRNGELVVNHDTLNAVRSSSAANQELNQLVIPYGKSSEIVLADGTTVTLNAGSRLIYPERFLGNTREVKLWGEAFFKVNHDPKHPFVVQVNGLRIKAVGTMFNVSAYPADPRIETVLTEGKVIIRQNNSGFFDRDTELVPGQLAAFDRQTGQIRVKSVDVQDFVLWTRGMLKFETEDLNRITKKLERFYNIRFHYNDPILGTLKISGKLELKDDRNEVIERIARTASVEIIKKGEDYYEVIK